jgi:cytochrome P450 family 6
MKLMFETVANKGADFVAAIKKENANSPVEMKKISAQYTCDIIGNCAFGIECGSLANGTSEILELSKLFFDFRGFRLLYLIFLTAFSNFSKKLGLRTTPRVAEDYFMNILKETVKYREDNNVKRNDFLNLLIQLKNKGHVEDDEVASAGDSRKLSFNQIAAQAFVFFL